MARKKNRPGTAAPATTDLAAPAGATAISTSPAPAPVPLSASVAMPQSWPAQESFWQTGLGLLMSRVFHVFASLPLAIVLLSFFTLCLALGTKLESDYSAEIAGNLLYR